MDLTQTSTPRPLAFLGARASTVRRGRRTAAPPGQQADGRGVGADLGRPAWARPALVGLLVATGLLYLWGLGQSGWGNSFYSAAVQAGSESWKAFFFGSSDAANAITVDKTPLALWPMELSVRIFGLSSWSILVPQALEGVATVYLLHRIVRRSTGSDAAGLLAGAAMALTPVAVLMFRFNNPDAMLVLLLVAASGATLRAVDQSGLEKGHPLRWLLLAGAFVGLAFLAKMLQAFLVLPALGLTYLLFARASFGKRVLHLVGAFGAMVLAGGWWVAIVELWPAGSRPYIGGSQNNSILELTLGYNGLGRLSGDETGSVGGMGGQAGRWGATGIGRLFNSEIGGQVAWLVPAALVLGGAALWFGRSDRRIRAATTLWGVTLLVTGLTFSFMAGIFHAYYTVALAPPIAALVGIGAWLLWRRRDDVVARAGLAAALVATVLLAFVVLGRTPDYLPWLRYAVLVAGLMGAALLVGLAWLPRRLVGVAAAAALASAVAAPAAYSLSTAGTAHTGSIPTAGPASAGRMGMPGGGPGGRFGGMPPGQMGGAPPAMPGTTGTAQGTQGTQGMPQGMGGGAAGGLLNGSTPSSELTALLKADAGSYTWVAAAVGSNTASGYQLATQDPVMAIGGFNGSDPSPTLAQFQAYVGAGKIHYFIAGGGMGGPGGSGSSTSSAITAWVEANFTAQTVGGVTLYDLSGGAA
ncbi:glycosyltransferase family 39 protein [Nocardioides pocheonensis]|uniref:Phospholipid carrier-dependent glycosyltransferase n=1 Tax=Nocardioides pocheonensis TaxID=661485 RepID=A0A3N0GNV1_9ACTN|nr:glycosyltransferase family 39 protein [Nocardioides pocheonensis]RNM14153.1 phospholipid carrier-dependent glycosyltransferase [Nocardioides pocheonensis]